MVTYITQNEAKTISTKPERMKAMRDVCPEPIAAAGGAIALRHMPGKGYAVEGEEKAVSRLLAKMHGASEAARMKEAVRSH